MYCCFLNFEEIRGLRGRAELKKQLFLEVSRVIGGWPVRVGKGNWKELGLLLIGRRLIGLMNGLMNGLNGLMNRLMNGLVKGLMNGLMNCSMHGLMNGVMNDLMIGLMNCLMNG